jgi:hypothetical protein
LNKLVLIKETSTIFLPIVLLIGTITLIYPSFIIGAQAESYYGGMDKDRKSINVSSLKCNNINVNVNGLELDVLPPSLSTLLTGGEANDNAYSYGSVNGNYGSESSGSETDFRFICINNNNNTVVIEQPEEPTTGTLKVTKQITCDDSSALEGDCEELLELLTEDQFTFQVEGNNPDPSSTFPGSVTGTDVILGPGNYEVLETQEQSVVDDLFTFTENNPDRDFFWNLDSSFSGDCNLSGAQGREAQARGTITAGDSQTCNAINAITLESEPIPPD